MRAAIFLIAFAVPGLALAAPPLLLDRGTDAVRLPVEVIIDIPVSFSAKTDNPAEMAKEREAATAALLTIGKTQADNARQPSSLNDLVYHDTDPRPLADKAPPEALKPDIAAEPSVRQAIPGFQLIEKTKAGK